MTTEIGDLLKDDRDCLIFLEGQITALKTIALFTLNIVNTISGDDEYVEKSLLEGYRKAVTMVDPADPIASAGMEYIFKEIKEGLLEAKTKKQGRKHPEKTIE